MLGSLSTLSYLFDLVELLVRRAPEEEGRGCRCAAVDQSFFTAWACGPLGPWVTANSTWSPSLSDLKPDASIAG